MLWSHDWTYSLFVLVFFFSHAFPMRTTAPCIHIRNSHAEWLLHKASCRKLNTVACKQHTQKRVRTGLIFATMACASRPLISKQAGVHMSYQSYPRWWACFARHVTIPFIPRGFNGTHLYSMHRARHNKHRTAHHTNISHQLTITHSQTFGTPLPSLRPTLTRSSILRWAT